MLTANDYFNKSTAHHAIIRCTSAGRRFRGEPWYFVHCLNMRTYRNHTTRMSVRHETISTANSKTMRLRRHPDCFSNKSYDWLRCVRIKPKKNKFPEWRRNRIIRDLWWLLILLSTSCASHYLSEISELTHIRLTMSHLFIYLFSFFEQNKCLRKRHTFSLAKEKLPFRTYTLRCTILNPRSSWLQVFK